MPPLSPKPALPPRNKTRAALDEDIPGDPVSTPLSTNTLSYKGSMDGPPLSLASSPHTPALENGYNQENSQGKVEMTRYFHVGMFRAVCLHPIRLNAAYVK